MKTPILYLTRALALIVMSIFAPLAHATLYDVVNVSALPNTFECSLVATQMDVTINGTNVHAMIYKDMSPGAAVLSPAGGIPIARINANVGDRIICHFTNNLSAGINPEGASVHWHGLELDNDSDGTGVTQDSVLPGQNYVYQFNIFRPGLYWFHSHMMPGNATFAGMYGALIIPNTNETALVSAGTLPNPTNTYTLVMSDIDFNPTNGVVSRQIKTSIQTNWFTINDIVMKCHLFETGQPGGDNAACSWAARPGKTVLVNGQAPTTNSPTQTPIYNVLAGQRVRLQLLNDAIARDFRLRLLNNGSGATTNLYRIGGQGGLINNVRVEGGIQGSWDTA
ncbi:MAG: multicopper oxidase type 3, partial [Verrucomicrobiales bacterium]|nr:multicopper oxidase type 3 [Verrucomicrobiales bacterium]